MAKVKRHYKAEYDRRIPRCAPKGVVGSQGGGNPKSGDASLSAKRRERSLSAATEAARA